ncbi:hypothetical protein [Pantoea brenneri]|uniref:hypothetical protein n=1 Tax=Pantoea brenneri TaxID=472694 RepID=UPI0013308CBF|nr:hypothetical protein [Pantoea brenneri]
MNKQQFKAMRSEYRAICRELARQLNKHGFMLLQKDYPLAARCQPSDRPVSIRVWLKLDDIRRSREVQA